jgi:hypothetical protein
MEKKRYWAVVEVCRWNGTTYTRRRMCGVDGESGSITIWKDNTQYADTVLRVVCGYGATPDEAWLHAERLAEEVELPPEE